MEKFKTCQHCKVVHITSDKSRSDTHCNTCFYLFKDANYYAEQIQEYKKLKDTHEALLQGVKNNLDKLKDSREQ